MLNAKHAVQLWKVKSRRQGSNIVVSVLFFFLPFCLSELELKRPEMPTGTDKNVPTTPCPLKGKASLVRQKFREVTTLFHTKHHREHHGVLSIGSLALVPAKADGKTGLPPLKAGMSYPWKMSWRRLSWELALSLYQGPYPCSVSKDHTGNPRADWRYLYISPLGWCWRMSNKRVRTFVVTQW